MCGLVGVAGDVSGVWKDLFNQLLLFDSVRGMHSTGAGLVKRFEGEMSAIKRVGHPFNLFHSDEYQDAMATKNTYKVLIGHNRHATFGAKTEVNAHPFKFADIMGAHNGTLDNHSVRDLVNYKLYDTDSEAIFATIQAMGLEATAPKLSGAWALTFYDKKTDTINFLRNSKRPLHYCYSYDRCTLIWASELEMLKYVIARSGKRVEQEEVKAEDGSITMVDRFFSANADTWYSWKIPDSVAKKFDLPTQTKAEGAEVKSNVFFTDWKKNRDKTAYHGTNYTKSDAKSSAAASPLEFHSRLDTAKFRPPYKDTYGRVIIKKEFFPIVNEGCAICNEGGQAWGSFIHLMGHYTGYHTPYLCETCYNDETTYEFAKYSV